MSIFSNLYFGVTPFLKDNQKSKRNEKDKILERIGLKQSTSGEIVDV